ncbi:DUF2993 domain-containing protein [Streptomyces sp. B1866]|uniref:LmeA family phospholipid-binding protein n=1 Tax=Streptomyces sp. B1866 TaxID=3075431 RepID=UPI00288D1E7E|nr:DUF2993 domain-containing protein [Streptomyces sp. B1866]MDT3400761.1 DUF2993 domain-containing protein [Streptomyces sp. B1866]
MRALRITLIVVVILAGLFVGADRLAVNIVESQAADKIKSRQGLTTTPHVSIGGFPFLTQVVSKDLDKVSVRIDDMETQTQTGSTVRVDRMRATLHDVHISGDFSSATADSASGSSHITYADLTAAAPPGLTVGYAGENEAGRGLVKVTGGLLGFQISANSTVSVVDGDTIRLRAETISGVGSLARWEDRLRHQIDIDRHVEGLPTGLRLDEVEVTQDGVDISVAGNDVRLTD